MSYRHLGSNVGFAAEWLQGRALDGPVYAAAKKAAHMQPLNPAAHNVLGLASGGPLLLERRMTAVQCCVPAWMSSIWPQIHQDPPTIQCPCLPTCAEARGDFALAVASYKLALRLALVTRDPDASVQHPHTISNTNTSLQTGTVTRL
jgi:hypothetical protein